MPWIESHTTLARHPKTLRLARRLGVAVPTAIGHLHLLWWWALEYVPDGNLAVYEPDDVAAACSWDGDGALFWEALLAARFVDADGMLHDWHEYVGRLLEQRALHQKRVQRNKTLYADMELIRVVRTRDGDDCRYCGLTVDWRDRKSAAGGTYDHVDPEGPNSADNVVVSCRGCNSSKGRRTPAAADKRLRPPPVRQTNGRLSAGDLHTVPNLTVPNRTKAPPTTPRVGEAPRSPDAGAPDASDAFPVPLGRSATVSDPSGAAHQALWDAFTDIFGEARTQPERNRRGKACQECRKAQVAPQEVRLAALHWGNVMADATMSEMGIVSNLGKLLTGPQVNGRSNGTTLEHRQRLTQSAHVPASSRDVIEAKRAQRGRGG